MNGKYTKNKQYSKLERLQKGVVFIFLAVFLSAALMGCQALEKKALREKNQIEIEKRKDNVEAYVLDYLTKKYHEEFISHGLINSNVAWDMADKSGAMLEFHMEAVESGINIKPVYSGAYIFPDSDVLISEYKFLSDGDYWLELREYDFIKREQEIVDRFFEGYKPRMNVHFSLLDPPYSSEFFRDKTIIDPKYLNIEYYLNEDKGKLKTYTLTMDYFKDIKVQTKDAFLENVYNFILYTRSLGFKHCSIDINIFDETFRDSEAYKQYLADDEGVNLGLYCQGKNIRTIMVNISSESLDKIMTLEDLIEMKIFREFRNNTTYKW